MPLIEPGVRESARWIMEQRVNDPSGLAVAKALLDVERRAERVLREADAAAVRLTQTNDITTIVEGQDKRQAVAWIAMQLGIDLAAELEQEGANG